MNSPIKVPVPTNPVNCKLLLTPDGAEMYASALPNLTTRKLVVDAIAINREMSISMVKANGKVSDHINAAIGLCNAQARILAELDRRKT